MFHLKNFTIGIYKKRESNYHLFVLVIFPDLDIIKFLSVNYMSQVCKSYNQSWTFPTVYAIFNLSVFGKQ